MQFFTGKQASKVLALWIALGGVLANALLSALAGLFTPKLLYGSALIGVLTVFLALWYPPRYCRSMQGVFDGEAVRAVQGVLWKKELFVPMTALRTFEISSTPLQRYFGCRTVVLRFAGGAAWLPLLAEDMAYALTRALEQRER